MIAALPLMFTNAFLYVDSYGLPLQMLVEYANSKEIFVDLEQFKEDARVHGWSEEKIMRAVDEVGHG